MLESIWRYLDALCHQIRKLLGAGLGDGDQLALFFNFELSRDGEGGDQRPFTAKTVGVGWDGTWMMALTSGRTSYTAR